MLRALAAILITTSFVSTAGAQTRLEQNAEDVSCAWKDSRGHSGKDICHITAQGTIMGETLTIFHIGERKLSYMISDQSSPELGYHDKDGWHTVWKGKLIRDSFTNIKGDHATETIKLSDGMTIKLFR